MKKENRQGTLEWQESETESYDSETEKERKKRAVNIFTQDESSSDENDLKAA